MLCRICGYQLLNSKDDGTQLIPFPGGDERIFGQRPQTSVLEDVEEFGAFDSQGCVSYTCSVNVHNIHVCSFIAGKYQNKEQG